MGSADDFKDWLDFERPVLEIDQKIAELENGVASIPGQLGKPGAVLADAGYVNADAFDRLEQEGVEIYCSVHREDAHNERHYDFRPEKVSGRVVKEPTDERLVAMRDKLRTEEGKALYGRRNHTVEPVFGIIKAAMGFRGFSLRGKEKAAANGRWYVSPTTSDASTE